MMATGPGLTSITLFNITRPVSSAAYSTVAPAFFAVTKMNEGVAGCTCTSAICSFATNTVRTGFDK